MQFCSLPQQDPSAHMMPRQLPAEARRAPGRRIPTAPAANAASSPRRVLAAPMLRVRRSKAPDSMPHRSLSLKSRLVAQRSLSWRERSVTLNELSRRHRIRCTIGPSAREIRFALAQGRAEPRSRSPRRPLPRNPTAHSFENRLVTGETNTPHLHQLHAVVQRAHARLSQ
jgi:hypothetical protein